MEIFLITYDLRRVGQNYTELYDAIKSLGDWRHPMESVWFVAVDNNHVLADHIYDKLRYLIDENDSVFVVNITGRDCSGWAPKSLWSWLNLINKA